MTVFPRWLLTIFTLCLYLPALSAGQLQLASTESDPDAFIQNSVNVINGDYCESATDLVITGPDALVLQRFYSTKDAITGVQAGGWRMLPQRFLVVGKDPSGKSCTVGKDRFEWTSAFTGERSGGILPYSGWRNTNGSTKDPLKIDVLNSAIGLVNTYAQEINGQTNHQNNLLHCKGDTCELKVGDGTRRIYQRVNDLPSQLLGEELTPIMAAQVIDPTYFLLIQEVLPSGNQLFFSYDQAHHLIAIEMKNPSGKPLSWIHFSYELAENKSQIYVTTSDNKELTYHFIANQLTHVSGSHYIPITYEYDSHLLVKKVLPEGRFVEIAYQDGKVQALKGPHALSGKAEIAHTFSYGKDYTDVFDAMGIKTRYIYDKRFQLTVIERYDDLGKLYRTEHKFWGRTKADAGLLLAKAIGDGNGRIYSYRCFQYDKSGNVTEERLYGNLTGKQEVSLQISLDGKLLNADEECHVKTFGYSTDGFNLLTKMGDCKGNQTLYTYKPGTNLLLRKLIYDKGNIKKRTFQSYNEDGVCIKVIEDDGSQEEESKIYGWSVTERHIKEIEPKSALPGVGLPEVIQEKALDLKTKKEILIKKLVNTYDAESNLLSCDTYDANGEYAFTEKRTYTHLGQIASQTDAIGREIFYTYDGIGNEISRFMPLENRFISTTYDFHNKPIQIVEANLEESITIYNTYDVLGRKTASIDRFGNTTHYEYDVFHRLTKVVYPEVLDESGQAIHPTFHYTYDIFGNVLELTDTKGFITTKSYNLRGNPTRIYYPDGSSELFKYDPEGSLHRSLTREKIITVYEYDYLGRVIYEESSIAGETGVSSFLKSRSYQYNGFRCTYEKDDDHIKRYSFNPSGKLTAITEYGGSQNEKSPDARLTEYIYDSLGRIKQSKVWFDTGSQDYALECYSYDLAGNIIEKRIEDAGNAILLQKYYTYNLQGQCEEEYTLENGIKRILVKTIYNSQGEPICYINGLGQEAKIVIDNRHLNTLGQTVLKKTLINSLGIQIEMEFDALGRLYSLCKKDPFGILLSSQKHFYDALGNKASEIHDQVINGKIVSSQKTERVYGPMGRLEEETQAAGSPLSKRIYYEYNTLGKLISKNLAGTSIQYTYNKDGNLHKIESSNSKKELQVSNSYSYDRKGNITSAYSLQGKSVQRTYTPFNQVSKETIKDGEGTYTLEYSYDRKGRLKTIALPDQSKIAYTYDAVFGREVNRISSQGKILYTHTYDTYDLQGKLTSENHMGYAGSQEYTYNLNGQKITTKSDFFNEEIVRDVLGRITEVKGEKPEHYIYNDLSQLISEKKQFYTYDSLDNRIQINNDELVYNALNQLISHAKTEFSYDLQGNLLRKVLDGEETRFESNILSQLTSIEKADQTALTFSYDPFGRLLVEKYLDVKGKNKKTLATTRYLYLGYQEIGTLSSTGAIENLKIPGLQGDELSSTSIAFEIKGETCIPLHDIAGNVVRLINPQNRQVLESYEYTAFGQVLIFNAEGEQEDTSFVGNPWQFAEKRMDDKSGLILFGLRFYDPNIGRWINQDPIGSLDGPNPYAYLHNNPLNHLDRFGLATESNSQNKFEEYLYGEVESHCYCEKHRTCKRGGDIGKTAGSHLPKVTHNYYFEKYYKDYRSEELFIKDCYDDSTCYDLSTNGLQNLPNDLGIGFINGIWNNLRGSKEGAEYVSRLAGGYNVHAVYNATHGDMDLPECLMGLNYIATEPVRQLHKMWNSFFEKSSATAKFLMICHSQGAIHVRNALLDYPPELRERILVVAIAPAAYIYKETCAKVIHYRAEWWRDLVPRFDRAGAKREKDTIVTLASHPDALGFDHEFMSLTYQEKLQEHIRYYIQTQGGRL
jgi:RHS repeat-associated protein